MSARSAEAGSCVPNGDGSFPLSARARKVSISGISGTAYARPRSRTLLGPTPKVALA
jgi:hypothetical protein